MPRGAWLLVGETESQGRMRVRLVVSAWPSPRANSRPRRSLRISVDEARTQCLVLVCMCEQGYPAMPRLVCLLYMSLDAVDRECACVLADVCRSEMMCGESCESCVSALGTSG